MVQCTSQCSQQANFDSRNARVVVARLVVITGRPAVDVDMLNLDTSQRDGRRDKDVVELFHGVLVRVCVSLGRRDVGEGISLEDEVVESLEDRTRLDEFVKIACDYDARKRVELED